MFTRIPTDAAELADEIGLPAPRDVVEQEFIAHVRLIAQESVVALFKRLRILIVIVCIVDVALRHGVRIAGDIENGAGEVRGLRRHEQSTHDVVVIGDALIHAAQRFIERTPADNARVVVIAHERFHPLREKGRGVITAVVIAAAHHCAVVVFPPAAHRLHAAETPVAELAPDKITEPVGVIEEAFLKHLLVQARAVEAGR